MGYEAFVGWYSIIDGFESMRGSRAWFGELRCYELNGEYGIDYIGSGSGLALRFKRPSLAYVKLKSLFRFGIEAMGS